MILIHTAPLRIASALLATLLLVFSASALAQTKTGASDAVPQLIVCLDSTNASAESWRGAAAERGFGISFFTPAEDPQVATNALRTLCANLRRARHVERMRFVLVGPGSATIAALRDALRYDIAALVTWGGDVSMSALNTSPYQAAIQLPAADLQEVFASIEEWRANQLPKAEAAGRADRVLDRFHECAARADLDGYFSLLSSDAVFLGTDASERWERDAFRTWAAPHFRHESAWIFLPLERHIALEPGEQLASFDEILGSESYGLCRGSGVLRLVDGNWQIVQYNLAFLIPNEAAKDVVAVVRKGARAESKPGASTPTTIYFVRHAEKAKTGGADPDLSPEGIARAGRLAEMLQSVPFDALISTQYKRTQNTLTPLAEKLGIERRTMRAEDEAGLVAELLGPLNGRTVLVCGHSNTVPSMIAALGVAHPPAIQDSDYTNLFCVVIDSSGARLQHLHF
jgi:phosphohistidine phosphatase SixA